MRLCRSRARRPPSVCCLCVPCAAAGRVPLPRLCIRCVSRGGADGRGRRRQRAAYLVGCGAAAAAAAPMHACVHAWMHACVVHSCTCAHAMCVWVSGWASRGVALRPTNLCPCARMQVVADGRRGGQVLRRLHSKRKRSAAQAVQARAGRGAAPPSPPVRLATPTPLLSLC